MRQKILMLDQKPFLLHLMQHHLERAGYELVKASGRAEAALALSRETPDLVVTADATATASSTTFMIPVIRIMERTLSRESNTPGNPREVLLTKPFSPTQLLSEVRRLIPESAPA